MHQNNKGGDSCAVIPQCWFHKYCKEILHLLVHQHHIVISIRIFKRLYWRKNHTEHLGLDRLAMLLLQVWQLFHWVSLIVPCEAVHLHVWLREKQADSGSVGGRKLCILKRRGGLRSCNFDKGLLYLASGPIIKNCYFVLFELQEILWLL